MGYPYPQHPYPQPGYGAAPRPPSGGTGIAAGVLSLLFAAAGGVGVIVGLIAALDPDNNAEPVAFIAIGVGALLVALWGLGGLLLCLRQPAGRVMVIGLSGLFLLLFIAGSILARLPAILPLGLMGTIFGLAVCTPTGRWIAARQSRSGQQPAGPYPAPYY